MLDYAIFPQLVFLIVILWFKYAFSMLDDCGHYNALGAFVDIFWYF